MALKEWQEVCNDPQCPLFHINNDQNLFSFKMELSDYYDMLDNIPVYPVENKVDAFLTFFVGQIILDRYGAQITFHTPGLVNLLVEFYETEPELKGFAEAKKISDKQIKLVAENAVYESIREGYVSITFKELAQSFIDILISIGEENDKVNN